MRPFFVLISISFFYCLVNSCDFNQVNKPEVQGLNDCGSCCNYLQFDSTAFDLTKLDSMGLDSILAKYKITETCANCLVNNFKRNGYRFPQAETDTGQANVKGFIMQDPEIRAFSDIVEQISKDTSLEAKTNIYGIFGIYHGQLSENSRTIITTPHQIFLVETILERPDTLPLVLGYYNFIRPCPDFCPGIINELEIEPVECK